MFQCVNIRFTDILMYYKYKIYSHLVKYFVIEHVKEWLILFLNK